MYGTTYSIEEFDSSNSRSYTRTSIIKSTSLIGSSSSSVYRVYSSLSVILQRDSQDKSPVWQYLQLKTGGNLIYTVRNWAGGKLPSVFLNSSTELAVVAADGRLFHSRMDLGEKEFR
jgi:hypothetical protein